MYPKHISRESISYAGVSRNPLPTGGRPYLRRLQIMLLFVLLFAPIVSFSLDTVEALPFDYEYTDQAVTVGGHLYLDLDLTTGDVLTGYFETHTDNQGLDFFIADETEYLIWDGGGTATVYENVDNMHTNSWSLTIPYSDTWYIVWYNDDSETITFDVGIDVNGNEIPYYNPSSYDYTAYGESLETDEWWQLSGTLTAGSVITGHFATFFTTDGVDFFICDKENYDIWEAGGTADVYGLKEDYHQASIDSFTVPTTGVWYLVWSAIGEEDTVTLSYGVTIDTSGATGGGGTIPLDDSTIILIFGAVAAIAVLLVVCIVCSKKKKTGPGTTTVTGRVDYPGSGSTIIGSSQKDIVEGALKSYPRITMAELAEIVDMDEGTVKRITLQLIADNEISGTFDRQTGEFISKEASEVGRELRDSAGILKLPRCPNCGAPLAGDHVIGDRVQCDNCGVSFTV